MSELGQGHVLVAVWNNNVPLPMQSMHVWPHLCSFALLSAQFTHFCMPELWPTAMLSTGPHEKVKGMVSYMHGRRQDVFCGYKIRGTHGTTGFLTHVRGATRVIPICVFMRRGFLADVFLFVRH